MHANLIDAAFRRKRHRSEETESRVQAEKWLTYVGLHGREEVIAS